MVHKGTKEIETERLILRPFNKDDAEAMFKNWESDLTRPLSSRHFLWTPVMRYKHNGLPLGFVLS